MARHLQSTADNAPALVEHGVISASSEASNLSSLELEEGADEAVSVDDEADVTSFSGSVEVQGDGAIDGAMPSVVRSDISQKDTKMTEFHSRRTVSSKTKLRVHRKGPRVLRKVELHGPAWERKQREDVQRLLEQEKRQLRRALARAGMLKQTQTTQPSGSAPLDNDAVQAALGTAAPYPHDPRHPPSSFPIAVLAHRRCIRHACRCHILLFV